MGKIFKGWDCWRRRDIVIPKPCSVFVNRLLTSVIGLNERFFFLFFLQLCAHGPRNPERVVDEVLINKFYVHLGIVNPKCVIYTTSIDRKTWILFSPPLITFIKGKKNPVQVSHILPMKNFRFKKFVSFPFSFSKWG